MSKAIVFTIRKFSILDGTHHQHMILIYMIASLHTIGDLRSRELNIYLYINTGWGP